MKTVKKCSPRTKEDTKKEKKIQGKVLVGRDKCTLLDDEPITVASIYQPIDGLINVHMQAIYLFSFDKISNTFINNI